MILPDTNLFIYSVDNKSPHHAAAAKWLKALLNGSEPIAILSSVAFSFVRIITNARILPHPLTVDEGFRYIENWLQFEPALWVDSTHEDFLAAGKLLASTKSAGGNLVSDAQIAAAAQRLNATIHSMDSDFSRFPNIKWHNPL